MTIDIPTLLILLVMICTLVGLIFFAAAVANRGNGLYFRAAGAAFLVAVGVLLVLLRGVVPDRISIDLGLAFLALGVGIAWSAVRIFEGRSAPLSFTVAGTAIWLAACAIPAFHDSIGSRIALQSSISAAYSLASGYEFWRGRHERLRTRLPIAVLLFAHGGAAIVRAIYSYFRPPTELFAGNPRESLLMAEPILMVIALALLCVGLVRERTENVLRRNADTDELTGALSRRALLAGADLLLADARRHQRSIAVLLFDLDHFKEINDQFGHQAGDLTLQAFARIACRAIRAGDLFGRLGGEEFAAVLSGVGSETAQLIADRIRVEFAERAVEHEGKRLSSTVSAGIAASTDGTAEIETLLGLADKALYTAKREGRDRVRAVLALAG